MDERTVPGDEHNDTETTKLAKHSPVTKYVKLGAKVVVPHEIEKAELASCRSTVVGGDTKEASQHA